MRAEDVQIQEEEDGFVLSVRRNGGNGAAAPWHALTRHLSKEDAQNHAAVLLGNPPRRRQT